MDAGCINKVVEVVRLEIVTIGGLSDSVRPSTTIDLLDNRGQFQNKEFKESRVWDTHPLRQGVPR